jgi:predicted nucleic acid-binding Zn ribbon protein
MGRSERGSGRRSDRAGGARRATSGSSERRRPRPRPTRVERHGAAEPPEGIGGILQHILGERRMRKGVALGRLARAWPQVVGEELARQTTPRALDEGGLLVAASSAAWGSQVRFLAREIRRRANVTLGSEVVRKVRVTVGGESWKPLRHKGNGAVSGDAGGPGKDPSR